MIQTSFQKELEQQNKSQRGYKTGNYQTKSTKG
jgi:hypothetical protein